MEQEEFFGNADQRALLRRGQAMAHLVRDDVRFSYYGRTVGLTTPDDGDIADLAALAKLQGNASFSAVPTHEVNFVKSAMQAHGLAPMNYTKWEGAVSALAAAQKTIKSHALPDDLSLVNVDATTPLSVLGSLAEMALECGVLPLSGKVLRGQSGPAVCMIAVNQEQKVVSCAAVSVFAHQDHGQYGDQAWWGMLATCSTRRRQCLALILGAHAMMEMNKRHKFSNFMTGVEPGNTPSEAVCRQMGLAPKGFDIVSCADPMVLRSGRMTK